MNIKGKVVRKTNASPSSLSMLYSSMEDVPVTIGVGTIHSHLPSDTIAYMIADTHKWLNVDENQYIRNQVYHNNQGTCFGDPVVQQLNDTQISTLHSVVASDVNTVSDLGERLTGSTVYTDGCLPSTNIVAPILPNASPSHVQVNSYLDKGKGKLESYSPATLYVPKVDGSYSTFVDRVYLDGCPNIIAHY